MGNLIKAKKIEGYILEPLFDLTGIRWQSHHVTNPAAFRPSFDDRVYLGYRAGGDRDHYCINDIDVWSSSLGLALLDARGERVIHRLPLPIMKIIRKKPLPQSQYEYEQFVNEVDKDIAVLHDFRIFEFKGYLNVIYHDGTIHKAFDCVKRMKIEMFQQKVETSISLLNLPLTKLEEAWTELWWKDDTWENAGYDGTRLIYPSDTNKNDIIFYPLGNGELQMQHRPLPDMAVLNTVGVMYSPATNDGIAQIGVLETCVRPGYFDNSHVGGNGMPTEAYIENTRVYIDICHGVNNTSLSVEEEFKCDMTYLPFLRIKDFYTGDLLYYSEEPILELDETWREYAEFGRWISILPHRGIIFAGGQIEAIKGKNGIDDLFSFYSGVGDSAIARAEFTLRQLLPEAVICDISKRSDYSNFQMNIPENQLDIETKVSGWNWSIYNDSLKKCIVIERSLKNEVVNEIAKRYIYTLPGNFDANALVFEGSAMKFFNDIGWCIIYKGIRWTEENGVKQTYSGYGVLVMDKDNLEKVLYRSVKPIEDSIHVENGWTLAENRKLASQYLEDIENLIPEQVLFEIKRSYDLISNGKHWQSHHTLWLQKKAES